MKRNTVIKFRRVLLAIGGWILSLSAFAVSPDPSWSTWLEKVHEQCSAYNKSILTNFWQAEIHNYELNRVGRGLIEQIDNAEMLIFLKQRGVQSNPRDLLKSDNLIAYLRYKKIGTETDYAWIDLKVGNPDFIQAVQDWQSIRNKRGNEFVPSYYLLFRAKLTTKRDCEVWSDIFISTFNLKKA
jgi:hypothetical protein